MTEGLAWLDGMQLPAVEGGFKTIVADPPWRFTNRTGKMAPEHKRLWRYNSLSLDEIASLPVEAIAAEQAHLYLWVPNALLPGALQVMEAWGFNYKTNLIWFKCRKDGGPDRRGVGFYYRNVTEMLLLGVRGHMRTLKPGRKMPNFCKARKSNHSTKPERMYQMIELCSPAPRIDLFARKRRPGWWVWGDEVEIGLVPEEEAEREPLMEQGAFSV